MNTEKKDTPQPILRQTIRISIGRVAKLRRILDQFVSEDPGLRFTLEEDGSGCLLGTGHTHLDMYVEMIRKENELDLQTGAYEVIYNHRSTETWHVKQQPFMTVNIEFPAEKIEVMKQFILYKRGEVVSAEAFTDELPGTAKVEAIIPLIEMDDFASEVKRIGGGHYLYGASFLEYRDVEQ